jgi:hypothetical protein
MGRALKIGAVVVAILMVAAVAYQGALKYYASQSTVDWPHDLAAAKARALASGKPLLVKIGAHG